MAIELYVFQPSPRAFKVMAVANHLGLDCELRLIDLRKGDQKGPQYAALNPNMRMPTLKDGDFVLWESNAIARAGVPVPCNHCHCEVGGIMRMHRLAMLLRVRPSASHLVGRRSVIPPPGGRGAARPCRRGRAGKRFLPACPSS